MVSLLSEIRTGVCVAYDTNAEVFPHMLPINTTLIGGRTEVLSSVIIYLSRLTSHSIGYSIARHAGAFLDFNRSFRGHHL